ncbi:hypothetical protein [uncultured Gammaproteobacteria bacterium]|nr:hypothetical protein [uncultured Gammaproteobacteria bacterium]CAC9520571.1 hypothetical protein [uncultured Gammaproteobacteria bacterium]CAC9531160.1 hypothetical protein [uncultured Gammaproteobacteria bacterium]
MDGWKNGVVLVCLGWAFKGRLINSTQLINIITSLGIILTYVNR